MIFIMSKKNYDFFSIIKFMSSSHLPQQGVHSNSASISRHLVTPASITAATSRSLIPLQLQTNIIELTIFQHKRKNEAYENDCQSQILTARKLMNF